MTALLSVLNINLETSIWGSLAPRAGGLRRRGCAHGRGRRPRAQLPDGDDLEGLSAKVAYLRKRSSRGVWQRRHVRLQNRWLLYAKRAAAAAPDAQVDLGHVLAARLVSRFGEFVLEFDGGKALAFRAPTLAAATDWVASIKARIAYFERLAEAEAAREREDEEEDDDDDDDDATPAASKAGWLKKRSGTRWQRRWLVLDGPELTYAREPGGDARATVSVSRVRWASASADCRDLRVSAGARVFEFRAETRPEGEEWFEAMGRAFAAGDDARRRHRDAAAEVARKRGTADDADAAARRRLGVAEPDARRARKTLRQLLAVHVEDPEAAAARRRRILDRRVGLVFDGPIASLRSSGWRRTPRTSRRSWSPTRRPTARRRSTS